MIKVGSYGSLLYTNCSLDISNDIVFTRQTRVLGKLNILETVLLRHLNYNSHEIPSW